MTPEPTNPMRPTLVELIQSDTTKMTQEELRIHISRLQAWQKKDFRQMLEDEFEGKPEHDGFIYLLSHEAMPGLLKIGFTTGPVEKRATEIAAATGVPGPFKVAKKFPVYVNPKEVEKKVHIALSGYRTADNREFFRISVEDATIFIHAVFDGKFDGA